MTWYENTWQIYIGIRKQKSWNNFQQCGVVVWYMVNLKNIYIHIIGHPTAYSGGQGMGCLLWSFSMIPLHNDLCLHSPYTFSSILLIIAGNMFQAWFHVDFLIHMMTGFHIDRLLFMVYVNENHVEEVCRNKLNQKFHCKLFSVKCSFDYLEENYFGMTFNELITP